MRTLDHLERHQTATVCGLTEGPFAEALAEAGVAPGAEVEVLARGLFGGTPLSVRVGRAVLALRKAEAAAVVLA